jgi:NADPH-dependent glutamate synthase beta subunit-like oxidoreductase
VTTAAGILAGNHVPGRRCVVVDEEGHCTAPTTADFLAQRGHQVTLISRYFMVGEDIDEGVRADLYARLFKQGVRVETTTVATEVVAGGVRVRHTYSGAEGVLEADTVVMAFGGKAEDGLYHELEGRVPDLKLVGDAYSPRRIHDAILDGTRAARAI